jgi:uncharacterized protein YbjT (DUF2867 family)
MPASTILVTAASGTIGSRTIARLLADPGVTVRAGFHGRADRSGWSDRVDGVALDYDDPATIRAAAEGVDAVLLTTPFVPHQQALAERALEQLLAAGVPRLVRISSIGAERPDGAILMREHGVTERLIAASEIDHTFLRPNLFMSNFATASAPQPDGSIHLPWGDAGVSIVDPRDVAAAAAAVLTSDGHSGRAYTLTGPRAVTGAEIAAEIEQVSGRRIRYVDTPAHAMRAGLLGAGMPAALADPLLDLFAANKAGETAFVTDAVRELTGRAARGFADYARDHAHAWRDGDAVAA